MVDRRLTVCGIRPSGLDPSLARTALQNSPSLFFLLLQARPRTIFGGGSPTTSAFFFLKRSSFALRVHCLKTAGFIQICLDTLLLASSRNHGTPPSADGAHVPVFFSWKMSFGAFRELRIESLVCFFHLYPLPFPYFYFRSVGLTSHLPYPPHFPVFLIK